MAKKLQSKKTTGDKGGNLSSFASPKILKALKDMGFLMDTAVIKNVGKSK